MKTIGEKSEVSVLAELIKKDIAVSLPFGDNQRYDMIIDIDGKLYKVQIKTANYKDNYLKFKTSSSAYHRNGTTTDYKGQIDYFIAYCHELNKMYIIHVDEAGTTEVRLRLNASKNNQTANVKFAKDYEFDNFIERLK